MEKRKPSYDLKEIKKQFILDGKLNITKSALVSAENIGFYKKEILDVVNRISHKNFKKSMTSKNNYKIWQDVYNINYKNYNLYVKFTSNIVTEFLLISFKEV